MKLSKTLSLFILITVMMLVFPSPVFAQSPDGEGKIVFGGSYELKRGETLSGDLSIFGGTATINENALVDGDVFIMGGFLELNGTITGDLVAIGGNVKLGDASVLEGNLTTINATVQRSPGSKVKGSTTVQTPGTFDLNKLPFDLIPFDLRPGSIQSAVRLDLLKPIGDLLWALFKAFGLAALALLIMLFLEKPTGRIAQTMVKQPIIAGALGLLTFIVAPALLILLGITIILLPISLLGFLVLATALLYGWIAAGFEVGKRLSTLFKWECAAPACAGIGTFILTLVATVMSWIPCIGWLAPALVLMLGLGSVLIARFGVKSANEITSSPAPYPPATLQQASPVEKSAILGTAESTGQQHPQEQPSEPPKKRQRKTSVGNQTSKEE
ncbi:MAG: polymer-forming cytoskeletal protein [Anaerolineae bacterium]|nr:polymer-forming cytoskeletal protein [Anaerolineae bacterium]